MSLDLARSGDLMMALLPELVLTGWGLVLLLVSATLLGSLRAQRLTARVSHRLITQAELADRFRADVAGHHERPFEAWRDMIGPEEKGWVATRGDHVVGVAIGRVFADGRAWIHQLAVAHDERGNGIGRALLLEMFRIARRVLNHTYITTIN